MEGRGEMNCGNLGEVCGRRYFQEALIPFIVYTTSIEFLKQFTGLKINSSTWWPVGLVNLNS